MMQFTKVQTKYAVKVDGVFFFHMDDYGNQYIMVFDTVEDAEYCCSVLENFEIVEVQVKG